MLGILLSNEEMKHFRITKDQVLSRRESLINNAPRLFVVLCSVKEAEAIVEKHPNVVVCSWGEYTNRGGKRSLMKAPKGTVLGPINGFRHVSE